MLKFLPKTPVLCFQKVMTNLDINSFIDIDLDYDNNSLKIDRNTELGLVSGKTYNITIGIGANNYNVTFTGVTQVNTIGQLMAQIESAITTSGDVHFIEIRRDLMAIRIVANSNDPMTFTDTNNLLGDIKGNVKLRLRASLAPICNGGGFNFKLSNKKISGSAGHAVFIADAIDTNNNVIEITKNYDISTGYLQVKRSSGSFSLDDKIHVIAVVFPV